MAAGRRLGFEVLDPLLLRLVRRVDGEMRQVEEERPVLVAADEVHRLVGEEIGEVRALADNSTFGLVAKSKCTPIETIASSKPRLPG